MVAVAVRTENCVVWRTLFEIVMIRNTVQVRMRVCIGLVCMHTNDKQKWQNAFTVGAWGGGLAHPAPSMGPAVEFQTPGWPTRAGLEGRGGGLVHPGPIQPHPYKVADPSLQSGRPFQPPAVSGC